MTSAIALLASIGGEDGLRLRVALDGEKSFLSGTGRECTKYSPESLRRLQICSTGDCGCSRDLRHVLERWNEVSRYQQVRISDTQP